MYSLRKLLTFCVKVETIFYKNFNWLLQNSLLNTLKKIEFDDITTNRRKLNIFKVRNIYVYKIIDIKVCDQYLILKCLQIFCGN